MSHSSIAALPVAEGLVVERLGVPEASAAFAVLVAVTTKMDGCAVLYPALSAIFIAQFYHLALVPTDYLLIVLVSVLGSAATAEVTGATVCSRSHSRRSGCRWMGWACCWRSIPSSIWGAPR
ncbi:UNVERIFIED_ORG: Na+/H+-dicarboxylate symporter [Sphingomonas sp. R1F5B]